ncbi:TPA: carbon storage regulator [Legionella pneumophila subsp. pneumophila]|nr:carbon storage regulator [Legionella pneumophila subsp. pneumophila]HBD7430785.1 carbon storage regulator [Legionella pneumophila]HDO7841006.1 carbon storage regulator [Legionella pneumophila]
MLVLTRRKGEQIFIDKGQIQIQVTSLRRGAVTLGIKAPPHIDVDREEIFLRKQTNSQNTDQEEPK